MKELKRRNVIKAVLAYMAVSWIIVQIASIVFPAFKAPDFSMKVLIYFLATGFVFWVGFFWLYNWSPDGFKKTLGHEENHELEKASGQRFN